AALEDMGAGDTSKWDPAWSPKGGVLAYLDGVPGDVGEVMLITIANGHARSLDVSAEGGLAWTPDGGALAFESGRSLYAFDVATHRRRLLARNAAQPAWSPDGRRIAFVRSFGRNREICVMRPDGSAQRRLTHNPGADESPDWQPLR